MARDYRLFEIFSMTDKAAQEAVLHALRAQDDLAVEEAESAGKPIVLVRCRSAWRAGSVASRVAKLDPGSMLIRSSSSTPTSLAG